METTTPTAPVRDAVYVGQLPRNWEKAFGYQSETPRRWLAIYYTPGGDEGYYDDGIQAGTANPWLFIELISRGPLAEAIAKALEGSPLGRWALGSSETEATHHLLCDLETRNVFVAKAKDAHQVLLLQVQSDPGHHKFAELSEEEWNELLAKVEAELNSRRNAKVTICHHCSGGYVQPPDSQDWDVCPHCNGTPVTFEEGEGVIKILDLEGE